MDIFDSLKWHGHASFSIQFDTNVCFLDPFDFKKKHVKNADIILITHAHFDHWSPDDIEKIADQSTVIVGVYGCHGYNINRITKPHDYFEINGIKVRTVPAYNIKPERCNFHPRKNNWVGYIIEAEGRKMYHAGDTDFISEMKDLSKDKIDVAMLPMGGTYTMDVNEAIEAANTIKARATVPIHYRRLLGSRFHEAEEKFVEEVNGAVIMEEIL